MGKLNWRSWDIKILENVKKYLVLKLKKYLVICWDNYDDCL